MLRKCPNLSTNFEFFLITKERPILYILTNNGLRLISYRFIIRYKRALFHKMRQLRHLERIAGKSKVFGSGGRVPKTNQSLVNKKSRYEVVYKAKIKGLSLSCLLRGQVGILLLVETPPRQSRKRPICIRYNRKDIFGREAESRDKTDSDDSPQEIRSCFESEKDMQNKEGT